MTSTTPLYVAVVDGRADAKTAGCAAYFRETDSGAEVLEAIRRLAA